MGIADPNQAFASLISGQLLEDQFFAQLFQRNIIEIKFPSQRAIGDSSLKDKPSDGLREYNVK